MKRMVSILLAAALLLTGVPALAAAGVAPESERAQVLRLLEIMQGDETGDLQLARSVTRAEFCKLVIAASQYKDAVGQSASVDPYPDVPRAHWAAPYVLTARDTGLVMGRMDGTFHPGDTITLAEGVTMVLRLLGYTDNSNWPVSQLARYSALGLDDGVAAKGQDTALTRRDALHLFYNLLVTKTQAGVPYIQTLGHSLNSFGTVDLDALLAEGRSDPFLADVNWQASVPFSIGSASVTRDGRAADASAILPYDIVYYNDRDNSIEAYSEKVTGTISDISPNQTSPTGVTVQGKTYTLETQSMVTAFSSRGTWKRGDVVTLLLGRSGGVAGAVAAYEHSAAVYGIVTAIASAGALDENGNTYSARTVTILGTDGISYPFVWTDENVKVGDMAAAQYTQSGATVSKLTSAQLPAGYTLAPDARILDTWGDASAITVYPSRLTGVRLTGEMTRWYATNSAGEVCDLILKDVTGDGHKYGVITKVTEVSVGMANQGTYEYDSGGTAGVYSSTRMYSLQTGPAQIRSDKIAALKSIPLTTPDGIAGYPTAENVLYYEKDKDDNYTLSSYARLANGNFTLTGWYDNPALQGGLLRVIVGE